MLNGRKHLVWLLAITAWLAACGETTPMPPAATQPPTMPAGRVERHLLSYDDLTRGFAFASPVDESALAMPAGAAPPAHFFEGRLELLGEAEHGAMQVLQADFGPAYAHLPEFDLAFVQHDTYLIPAQRGLIITTHPEWNLLLEPGRAWREDGDGGDTRASFPFALILKGGNATFNGTMTFVFNDQGVSRVWYQVTQETASYGRANLWGLLEAVYHREPVAGAEQVRADFERELAGRFPTQPIEQLAQDYPGVDLAAFGQRVDPENMTWYGVVANGVNYVGGCRTRYGQYSYCEAMRASSYSTAKSAFVSVALMRLAQKYGPGVADLLIRDYLPEAADSRGDWQRVTFDHTLDMATGNYQAAGYMTDDDGPQMAQYFQMQPYDRRMAAALDWPHREEPGTRWVYRTCDTFILGRALHNYLQSVEGPAAELYQFVVDEVYRPLGVGPGAHTTMRTEDNNWQGQPEGGYGQWWVADDIAKITTLLNVDGGRIDGVQVLQPDLLAAALQRDPDDRGVRIDQGRQYNNAFWATRYAESDGFECEFWTAEMLGISGNVVVLLPNGTSTYYFSDSHEFFWLSAVRELDKITPLCPSN